MDFWYTVWNKDIFIFQYSKFLSTVYILFPYFEISPSPHSRFLHILGSTTTTSILLNDVFSIPRAIQKYFQFPKCIMF